MEKKVLAKLDKCYSIAPLQYEGKTYILVAAEKKDRCIMFDQYGNEKGTIWEQPGGVMTMVQVPGSNGQFLATHKFYSPNDSKEAKIVVATPDGCGKWKITTLVELPFVHRFDILTSGEHHYLIACTIKSGHEFKDDWTVPGKIYVAKLPADLSVFNEKHPLKLKVLKEGMLKNHGYYRVIDHYKMSSLICSENGVFRCYPPDQDQEEWRMEQLLDTPASDAVLIDLDQDGTLELVVMSPFHGDEIHIYKKLNGEYQKVYEYPEKAEFLHAIWCGKLKGKPTVVIGHRKGKRRLLAFTWDHKNEKYTCYIIDEDCGPANVFGYSLHDKDVLIAANREINEIAMYLF